MEKYSVRKPFTVLVAVIAVLALGFVSVTNMTMDLLPEISMPYLVIVTTYAGASPERVESEVGIPIEEAVGTISRVKNVTTNAAENYCMTQLEFEDGTDMDSATVKVSGALDQVTLPDACGKPSIIELSTDMIATLYVAVEHEGDDIYELSDYAEDTLIPAIERVDGVASVTAIGLVEKEVLVKLNPRKIDSLNNKILKAAVKALDEAEEQLSAAEEAVEEGQKALQEQEKSFGGTLASALFSQLDGKTGDLASSIKSGASQLSTRLSQLQNSYDSIKGSLGSTSSDLADAASNAENVLDSAKDAYEKSSAAYTAAADALSEAVKAAEGDGEAASSSISEASAELEEAKAGLDAAQAAYEDALGALSEAAGSGEATEALEAALAAAESALAEAEGDYAAAAEAFAKALEDAASSGGTDYSQLIEDYENAKSGLEDAQEALSSALSSYSDAVSSLADGISKAGAAVDTNHLDQLFSEAAEALSGLAGGDTADSISALMDDISSLTNALADIQAITAALSASGGSDALADGISRLSSAAASVSSLTDSLPSILDGLETAAGSVAQGQLDAALGFADAARQLSDAQQALKSARTEYESQRSAALESANADALLDPSTLAQMLYAQNFSMPAGYIEDEEGKSWLLKVGDEYTDDEEIADILLVDLGDAGGIVRLEDVADVTVTDNADEGFARLNGESSVILAIYKSSAAGTNAVSKNVNAALSEMRGSDAALSTVALMDQGEYITLIVESVLRSMVLGALLAVIVLALFLRDVRPTLLVAISIPLSVLFAIVLMYFSGITLNVMTLSGLALGIGMLVDNSIVVIENIFRLRGRGESAPRAAVQGARQVTGAIVSSTLTTVCVFLPMVFTTGTVRKLMVPMALTVSYCLLASLIVALTVVPAASSTLLRKMQPKESRASAKMKELYGKALAACLDHRALTLIAASALLALCVWRLVSMGVVLLPDMSGDSIELSVTTPETDTLEESHAKAAEVMEAVMKVEGVSDVSIMDMSGSTMSMLSSSSSSSSGSSVTYSGYVISEGSEWSDKLAKMCEEIESACAGIDATVTASSDSMSDFGALLSSGLTVRVSGPDNDSINSAAKKVAEAVSEIEGFSNVAAGTEASSGTLHLVIDKDKAMAEGFTVAQIYAQIAKRLSTTVTATAITTDGDTISVIIEDGTDTLTRENLLDMELAAAATQQSASDSADLEAIAEALGISFSEEEGESDEGASEDSENESGGASYKLGDFASLEEAEGQGTITRLNLTRYTAVTADTDAGYNTTVLTRELEEKLSGLDLGKGVKAEVAGETKQVREMVEQMVKLMLLAVLFIYLVMVAQFQSLLSPFIVMFTIPLAFTGGMIGLIAAGEQLSMLSLMGFLILMGTVVNNGIVFVDYANQLRLGGMDRRDALIATGKTRMRPILMTALTTILAMGDLIVGGGMGSQMGKGMAIVIAAGLLYATFMTLFIVPVLYDIMFKKQPSSVEFGDDLDEMPDDAAEFLAELRRGGGGEGRL